jgi:hypothetical protein
LGAGGVAIRFVFSISWIQRIDGNAFQNGLLGPSGEGGCVKSRTLRWTVCWALRLALCAATVQADGQQEVADYAGGQGECSDDAQAIGLWAIFEVIADGGAEEKNFEAGAKACSDFDQAVLAEEREQKSGGAGERGGDHRRDGAYVRLHSMPILMAFFYHVCRAEGYSLKR